MFKVKEVDDLTAQQTVNRYVEQKMLELAKKGDFVQFQQTIQQNISMKRESATSTLDFWDRIMLNITYYVENKQAWTTLFEQTFGAKQLPTVSFIQNEAMAQQMRIRQTIAEQTDAYIAAFHTQYEQIQATDEDVIYDYAYASVAHSLRFDFLTYVTAQQDAAILIAGDSAETIRIIEGYVDYYADQYVNQMKLQ